MNFRGRTITSAALRMARAPLLLVLLCLTAACTTNGSGPVATTGSFGPTVAFESVDGPPPQVFDRLVRALEAESTARSFTIVSREAQASYRVRSYLSAQVRRGKTTIAWVWDVYDRDQERVIRLSGEEPGGKGGRDAWATADDQLMRRIALAGLNGLNGLISGSGSAPDSPAPAAPRSGPAIAQTDENRPESASGQMQTLAFSAH
jgi:hypothetical protein